MCTETLFFLVDVSGIFFSVRGGGKEEGCEEAAGGSVLIKNRGMGGVSRRRRGRGKGVGGMSVGEGGGGVYIFFRGRNSHQVLYANSTP